mgnify:CR=1 FL=1
MDKEKDFSYTVGDIDELIDEKGNTVVLMRKLAWGSGNEKLEIRKWHIDTDKEIPSKGVTFLTDEGPHTLAKVLLEKNYGHTEECVRALAKRDDFDECLGRVIGKGRVDTAKKASPVHAKYYDPKELIKHE